MLNNKYSLCKLYEYKTCYSEKGSKEGSMLTSIVPDCH